jgi:Arc/MetJ-type ribon-helix-helix transcriptional regulator
MHRLNLTIDETLYKKARALSFLKNKSISQIVRESLSEYLEKGKEQTELLLEADDEAEVLAILNEGEFSSQDEFRKKYDL